jgi:hypothetical protein
MSKWAISLFVMVVGVLIFWNFLPHTRDFQVYQYLKMPHISERPAQKMLVVRLKGDPNAVGKQAMSTLFKAFYALKVEFKNLPLEFPRARWPQPLDTPAEQWVGLYGLPVPEKIVRLPKSELKVAPHAALETWEYGTVAEILHSGPYSEEVSSIEKLQQFIQAQGYAVVGVHEEEYLKGPGFFGRGDPKKYQTLIRYRVEKVNDMKSKPTAVP